MGWAIRQNYKNPITSGRINNFLLGRYYFSHEQQKHMRGYQTGVFATRREARDWLAAYKGSCSGKWHRGWCRYMTVVKVDVTIEESA